MWENLSQLSPEDGLRAMMAASFAQLSKCRDSERLFASMDVSARPSYRKSPPRQRSPASVRWSSLLIENPKKDHCCDCNEVHSRRSLVDRDQSTQPSPEANRSPLSASPTKPPLFSTPRKAVTPVSSRPIPALQRELRKAHAEYHRLETLYSGLLTQQQLQQPKVSYTRKINDLKAKLRKDTVRCI